MVQEVSATPKLRLCAATRRPSATTSASEPPASAQAPAIFSTRTAAPVPAAGRVQAVLDGHVVVHQDRLDLDALVGRQLGGDLEVHHVAGVVLDDVDDARAGIDGLRRGDDRVRRRRGEHLAGQAASSMP